MNRTNLLLFLITVFSVIWLIPEWVPFGNDREIFRFIGRSMGTDYLPYRDVFDHKAPLIYFIFRLTSVFGDYDILVTGTVALILCLSLFQRMTRGLNEAAALVIMAFLILWLRNPGFYEYGGLTREFTAYLYVLFLYQVHVKTAPGWTAFTIGLVFINQPNDILPLIPVWLNTAHRHFGWKVQSYLLSLIPAIIPASLVALIFGLSGVADDLYRAVFTFNFSTYTSVGPSVYPSRWLSVIKDLYFRFSWFSAGFVFIGTLLLMRFRKRGIAVLCLSLLLTAWNIAISGRHYGHYYLPAGPLLAYAMVLLSRPSPGRISWQLLTTFTAVVLLTGIYWMNRAFDLQLAGKQARQSHSIEKELTEIVNAHRKQADHLYVLNYTPGLRVNTLCALKPPAPYIYFSLWDEIPRWDPDLSEFRSSLERAASSRTILIDFTPQHPFVRPAMNNMVRSELSKHYQPVRILTDASHKTICRVYLPLKQ